MADTLTIALIQSPLVWHDAAANRTFFQEKIDAISESVDLVVLPEMFSTGFTMEPKAVAETMDGETVNWMKNVALKINAAVVGSLIIREESKFYNRLVFVTPDGNAEIYDKRHLFSLAGEDEVFTAGKNRLVVEFRGFKICSLICYDLRFPAFSRNNEDFDVLLYVANWPLPRISAWNALLKARAIENMVYVVGVNRIGNDSAGNEYPGNSQVLDFMGEFVLSAWENEGVFVATIEKAPMLEARKKLNFLADQDEITVT